MELFLIGFIILLVVIIFSTLILYFIGWVHNGFKGKNAFLTRETIEACILQGGIDVILLATIIGLIYGLILISIEIGKSIMT